MERKLHRYKSDAIVVTYDLARCIHAAECIRGLPAVFDTRRRPWVQPENAAAGEIAAVIERCPSGALHYERLDGGTAEPTPGHNVIQAITDGPLYASGDLEITTPQGTVLLDDTRVALCRCGASKNKPFCDNSHWEIDFAAPGTLAPDRTEQDAETAQDGRLRIVLSENGPLELRGSFVIASEDADTAYAGGRAWLCRCGGSGSKPFCDETHRKNGFTG
jgi:CDGSH-type Zn-finger protein/uncharacterized Fe-S cluster protein YjdI